MAIQAIVIAQVWVFHILVGKGKSNIWIIIPAFPRLQTIGLLIKTQYHSRRMMSNEMGNMRIMLHNAPIEVTGIQRIPTFIFLGTQQACIKEK